MGVGAQSRNWQGTINNPKPDYTHDKIKEKAVKGFKTLRFLAMSDEIGAQGTYHTHLLLCFDSAVRLSTIKKIFPTAHMESIKGTIKDNIDYIKKQGKWKDTEKAETSVPNTYEEIGERPPENKGKNKLMEELYHLVVVEGLSNAEIITINQDYIPHMDTITRLRTMFLQEKYKGEFRQLEVTYVFGKTATGKTRGVIDEHGASNVYRVTDYDHPFDGYNCEDVIVFDEFRSSLRISDMLNYMDGYPIHLPARYSNKFACYTKVYIISNEPLESQYPELHTTKKETWEAFLRRIKKIKEYTDFNKFTEYGSVKEYLDRNNKFVPVPDKDNPFKQ